MALESRRQLASESFPSGLALGVTNKVDFRVDPFWLHSTDLSAQRWEAKLVPKISRMSEYGEGWDGYSAKRVSYEACMFAINILNNIMRPSTPCPQVVPTSSGSVQIEWHEKGIDLEVRVSGAYKCDLYCEDATRPGDQPMEVAIGADLSLLIQCVDELSRR